MYAAISYEYLKRHAIIFGHKKRNNIYTYTGNKISTYSANNKNLQRIHVSVPVNVACWLFQRTINLYDHIIQFQRFSHTNTWSRTPFSTHGKYKGRKAHLQVVLQGKAFTEPKKTRRDYALFACLSFGVFYCFFFTKRKWYSVKVEVNRFFIRFRSLVTDLVIFFFCKIRGFYII